MKARDVMISPVITVRENETVRDVARLLVEERISAEVLVSPHAARYFATKRDKMGHLTGPDHAAPISCNINNNFNNKLCPKSNPPLIPLKVVVVFHYSL